VVLRWLRRRWSPQQIAARLRVEFPDRPEMWVSHETIYQAIYLQARGNLRTELARRVALRFGRRPADPARPPVGRCVPTGPGWGCTSPPAGRGRRPGGSRALGRRPGHRQRRRASAIATLVERATRFVMLVALPEGRVSEHVVSQLAAKMADLPERLRRSLTWDQGIEMAYHLQFTTATDCPVYVCDPHGPWQRGSNETPTPATPVLPQRQGRLQHHHPGRPRVVYG
jgi:IS30 family transposase